VAAESLGIIPFLLVRFTYGMDGLLAVAGIIIDSWPADHSRKFPTFSTSKHVYEKKSRHGGH